MAIRGTETLIWDWPAFSALLTAHAGTGVLVEEDTPASYDLLFSVSGHPILWRCVIYKGGQEPAGSSAQQVSDYALWLTDYEQNWQMGAIRGP